MVLSNTTVYDSPLMEETGHYSIFVTNKKIVLMILRACIRGYLSCNFGTVILSLNFFDPVDQSHLFFDPLEFLNNFILAVEENETLKSNACWELQIIEIFQNYRLRSGSHKKGKLSN